MRARVMASILSLSLLGGCGELQILYSERVDPAAIAEPFNASPAAQRRLPLHISNGFSAEEEAKIIAAVGDWNQTGGIRFDLAALNSGILEPRAWSISKHSGPVDGSSRGGRLQPAAITHRGATGGGSIVVDVDRLGAHDLRDIITLELGVAASSEDDSAPALPVAHAAR